MEYYLNLYSPVFVEKDALFVVRFPGQWPDLN